MFICKVTGVDRKSEKVRERRYYTESVVQARQQAAADFTRIDTCNRFQSNPASDAQVKYANHLSIEFENDISKDDLSTLITQHLAAKYASIRQSSAAVKMIEVLYLKANETSPTWRKIEAYRLVRTNVHRIALLCREINAAAPAGKWKTFVVDRISSIRESEIEFAPKTFVEIDESKIMEWDEYEPFRWTLPGWQEEQDLAPEQD